MSKSMQRESEELTLSWLLARTAMIVVSVWQRRRVVLGSLLVGGLSGLLIAFGSTEEFTAVQRVLPYRAGAASAGLSGLAGLSGIRLPGAGAEQAVSAELYPDIARTLEFYVAVAETPLRFSTLPDSTTAMTYLRDVARPSAARQVYRFTLGLPQTLYAMIRKSVSGPPIDETLRRKEPQEAIPRFAPAYLETIDLLSERLTISFDRKSSLIQVSARMPDAYAAADLVRVASETLMERIIALESRKAGENFRFALQQYDAAKRRYDVAQVRLAEFADRNRSASSSVAIVEFERLQGERNLALELYQQVSRDVEQARMKMSQDTPVFTVIDPVTVPANRSSPRRARILLLSLFLGGMVGVTMVWIEWLVSRVKVVMHTSVAT